MTQPKPRLARIPLALQIIIGMILGAAIGLAFGKNAEPLGEFGKLIITLIKTLALPLLFFAVIDAFVRTQIQARSAGIMIMISIINSTFAIAIGLALSNLLKPGVGFTFNAVSTSAVPPLANKINFLKTFSAYIPTSLVQPFLEQSVITVIGIAVLLGLALRKIKHEQATEKFLSVENSIGTALRTFEIMLGWIIKLVPLAVFGVTAKTVGENGFAPFRGLAAYVGVAILGLTIQIGIVYQGWILLTRTRTLRDFWKGASDAIFYAMGASSSLATLPVTLKCLDKMGVSHPSSRLAACVGTNLNNDGILLYEAMAVLFVAQAHGIHLTLTQQALAAFSCVIAGIGIAGIPEAGLISLSLVLTTVGLPLEILPLLLTVDWVLSRARAITNVISDILLSTLLDRFSHR